MEFFWQLFFWLIPIWTFVLIPFSTFYYEADDGMIMAGTSINPDGKAQSKLYQACCWQFAVMVVVGLMFGVTYLIFSDTVVPVVEYTAPLLSQAVTFGDSGRGPIYDMFPVENASDPGLFLPFSRNLFMDMADADIEYASKADSSTEAAITLKVDISTFFAALMAWLGWFLFALFGGIGMSSMPLDLLLTFRNRPRHMDAVEYAEAQMSLRERVNELVEIGELIKTERDAKTLTEEAGGGGGGIGAFFNSELRKEARTERQAILEFKQAVFLLEADVEEFQACTSHYENYNPLTPYIALLMGICSVIISLFWILHILLYVMPSKPLVPFLNSYFSFFDKFFPLFGVLSVALFTVYLLFAAVKGCFKFGLRVACITLHPMKVGKTYMSSMLFNIGLVLLCALPVVQFASTSFADYARFATIRQIFGVQIENLKFFGWWWANNIFVYIFFGFSVVTCLYLCCKPKETPPDGLEMRDRLRSRRGG
jgi:LMBR1 domain-containing protein 1